MTARAMWKAVVRIGASRVPVKLYSAVEGRGIGFRLLHAKDHAPVRQAMVNPDTDEVVPYEDTRRAFATEDGDLVVLDPDELAALEPEPSREIVVLRTVPTDAIDHRWYDRPYYLGPDGSDAAYASLIEALHRHGREAVARWTMRKKEYVGALRLHDGYPMLVSLRHAGEVLDLDRVETPAGPELDDRELGMAEQLIDMLADDFEPDRYRDEYRDRVLEAVEAKRRGERVETAPEPSRQRTVDLTEALQASLREAGGRA